MTEHSSLCHLTTNFVFNPSALNNNVDLCVWFEYNENMMRDTVQLYHAC